MDFFRKPNVSALQASANIQGLMKALHHSSVEIRKAAATALAELGANTAVPDLVRLLEDPVEEVGKAAEAAISMLVPAESRTGLTRADAMLRARKIAEEKRLLVLKASLVKGSLEAKLQAAKTIGDIGGPAAADILLKALSSTYNAGVLIGSSQQPPEEAQNQWFERQHPVRVEILKGLIHTGEITPLRKALYEDLKRNLDMLSNALWLSEKGLKNASTQRQVAMINAGHSRGEVADTILQLLRASPRLFNIGQLEGLSRIEDALGSRKVGYVLHSDPDISDGEYSFRIELSPLRNLAKQELLQRGRNA
jgi:hypothetical protein